MSYRVEKDLIGDMRIPSDKYYGINTARALENFKNDSGYVRYEIIEAIILIKKSSAIVLKELSLIETEKADAIVFACDEILSGKYKDSFVLPAIQGGAGTSTHMNCNEVIANIAIERFGGKKGDYSIVDPNDDVNRFQSTNYVYPTALKLAAIRLILDLSYELADLQTAFQEKEREFADVLKPGRTQLQEAVPITLGQEFSAFGQAVARDRWRVYKSEERLRQVNLGGTAVGTGINAPKIYIFKLIEKVRELSGIGLARAENMVDMTQNLDPIAEVSGILKAVAVNLIKISSDIRLLSSGPFSGLGEIKIEPRQAGSSIMPGKVNPVIPEFAQMAGIRIIANDSAITTASFSGQLELNAFMPIIADSLIDSIKLLIDSCRSLRKYCVENITCCPERCKYNLDKGFTMAVLLVPYIVYHEVSKLIEYALENKYTIKEAVLNKKIFNEKEIDHIFNPKRATAPGISGSDLLKDRIRL
ncbi:MAG: aspartate ammonia-lyase [Candidatus Muiribacterium halophilum]|uniref:Aspartate ammonia-lyase n=1 Tax=Muiribacterium halophilum TaxID=2053465 RepID=A0A2N5ZGA9_MUIH1|nr:MAG: aspartate ammonia-lyase [Candidatus Muirbacterium halophilum]